MLIKTDDSERIYETGEHCFHGEKYCRLGEQCIDESRKKVLLDYSKTFLKPSLYKTAAMAKKMGGKKGLMLISNELKIWEMVSIDVQNEICRWKADNYKDVRDDLLKSEDKILIHPAMRCSETKLGEKIWEGKGVIRDGAAVVLGRNRLGNIWMEIRDVCNKTR